MMNRPKPERQLQDLIDHTRKTLEFVAQLDQNMDKNEPEEVEQLQELIENREPLLQAVADMDGRTLRKMGDEHNELVNELQDLEESLQKFVHEFYQSFSNTMKHLEQGKNLSQRYQGNLDARTMDGAYFDRKR